MQRLYKRAVCAMYSQQMLHLRVRRLVGARTAVPKRCAASRRQIEQSPTPRESRGYSAREYHPGQTIMNPLEPHRVGYPAGSKSRQIIMMTTPSPMTTGIVSVVLICCTHKANLLKQLCSAFVIQGSRIHRIWVGQLLAQGTVCQICLLRDEEHILRQGKGRR